MLHEGHEATPTPHHPRSHNVTVSRRANILSWRQSGGKAHALLAGLLRERALKLEHQRGDSEKQKRLPRGEPALFLQINYCAVGTMESQVDLEEKVLSHLRESWGLSHLFCTCSVGAWRDRLCWGQGNGEDGPGKVLSGPWDIWRVCLLDKDTEAQKADLQLKQL